MNSQNPRSDTSLRILSLLPSATEIVCALGLKDKLIGRSHDCNYPEEVKDLPVCSQPNYSSEGKSLDINRSVQSVLEQTLSIYRVDAESVKALRPTHIISQSHCEVCAISTDELRRALGQWLDGEPAAILDSSPLSLQGIRENIRRIGEALGHQREADAVIRRMDERFDAVRRKTAGLERRPTVAHIEWIDPVMTGGHWVMDMIEWAGGVNCFPDEDSRWIDIDQLLAADPEIIVVAPCGFSIERTRREMEALTRRPEWSRLRAVRNGRVFLSDGSSFFNRPGPRLAESLEILGQIYHPELFPARHSDTGWERFEPNSLQNEIQTR